MSKGVGINDAWILKNVVPNITEQHIYIKTASILGRAIMWAFSDHLASPHVLLNMLKRVKSQYTCICTLDPTLNLIRKMVGFVVCGHGNQLFIDDLVIDDRDDVACSNDDTTSLAGIRDLNRRRKRQSAEL